MKPASNENREAFAWECMDFEICRLGYNAAIIMKGNLDRIIIYNLPQNITVTEAQIAVQAFFEGYKYAADKMNTAMHKCRLEDMKRSYYVGEES